MPVIICLTAKCRVVHFNFYALVCDSMPKTLS